MNKRALGGADTGVTLRIDADLLSDFPVDVARDFAVLPIHSDGSNLILATNKKLLQGQLEELHQRLGIAVHVVPCQNPEFDAVLESIIKKPLRKVEELKRTVEKPRVGPKAPLGKILFDLGLLASEEVPEDLKRQVEVYDLSDPSLLIERRVLDLVPASEARRYSVLPLGKFQNDLLLATNQNLNSATVAEIAARTGLTPRPLVFNSSKLNSTIERCYRRRQELGIQRMLVSKGLISRDQLANCLLQQEKTQESLSDLLVKLGYITEDALYLCLSETLEYEYRRFTTNDIDLSLGNLVSQRFATAHLALPLALDRKTGVLEVAVADPTDLKVMDMLKAAASGHGYRLKVVLSSPRLIRQGIKYTYSFRETADDVVDVEIAEPTVEPTRQDLVSSDEMPAIRRIVNKLLYTAVLEGASDVHLENMESRVRVRFRIDGILHERNTAVTRDNILKIISLFKIDAGLDITEHRRSQDGVFKKRIDQNRFLDFRINVHASEFGEDAVIRILDASRNLLPLDKLGFPPQMLKVYLKLIENPQGLILFTGPTGSGKSTTLYSTLGQLNHGDKKIVTAEDPVEYYLDGLCQYQVNDAIGNTFAEHARRALRKDPDIILIGEIRDEETADACLRAALTGHMVFSTLHTNNTLGVVRRLRDLEVESSSIAEALLAVIGQRLARRNCVHCLKPHQPDPSVVSEFYPEGVQFRFQYQRGTGCAECNKTGYRGRIGLYEFWDVTGEARQAIAAGEQITVEFAKHSGLMLLLEDGLRKVHEGITTLEELRRVVPLEEIRKYRQVRANSAA